MQQLSLQQSFSSLPPYEYQLSVMENAKESLINLRIARNLEKGLKENDQG